MDAMQTRQAQHVAILLVWYHPDVVKEIVIQFVCRGWRHRNIPE